MPTNPSPLPAHSPDVHPVEDTKVIWYQDGQHVSSTDNGTQNDDGTTDISQQIQVSETGIFTCNATYLSANGRENTAVSVEAWIIHVPPTGIYLYNFENKYLRLWLLYSPLCTVPLFVLHAISHKTINTN